MENGFACFFFLQTVISSTLQSNLFRLPIISDWWMLCSFLQSLMMSFISFYDTPLAQILTHRSMGCFSLTMSIILSKKCQCLTQFEFFFCPVDLECNKILQMTLKIVRIQTMSIPLISPPIWFLSCVLCQPTVIIKTKQSSIGCLWDPTTINQFVGSMGTNQDCFETDLYCQDCFASCLYHGCFCENYSDIHI